LRVYPEGRTIVSIPHPCLLSFFRHRTAATCQIFFPTQT